VDIVVSTLYYQLLYIPGCARFSTIEAIDSTTLKMLGVVDSC
jgi:hypothetical protein